MTMKSHQTESGGYSVVLSYISFNGTLKTEHPKLIQYQNFVFSTHFRFLQFCCIFCCLNSSWDITLASERCNDNHWSSRDLGVFLHSIALAAVGGRVNHSRQRRPFRFPKMYSTGKLLSTHISNKGKLGSTDFSSPQSVQIPFLLQMPLCPLLMLLLLQKKKYYK